MTKWLSITILLVSLFFPARHLLSQETENLSVFEDAYPYWSPDGTLIVFQSTRGGAFNQIYLMGRDGLNLTQLTFDEAHNRTPVFSPDGRKIAWQSERDGTREIYIMNTDGSQQTRLTVGVEESSHPKWSQDGTEIIFDSHRDHPESQLANIYIMKSDGSDVRRLTNYNEYDSYASLSPDGKKVLFRRVVPTGGSSESGRNSEVFIMNRDGSDLLNLTNDPDFDGYPSWSPDGQFVFFASNRRQENFSEFNIFRIRPDGTSLSKLTETMPNTSQARQMVSPDGRFIVFNRDFPDGRIEIHIMEILPK